MCGKRGTAGMVGARSMERDRRHARRRWVCHRVAKHGAGRFHWYLLQILTFFTENETVRTSEIAITMDLEGGPR